MKRLVAAAIMAAATATPALAADADGPVFDNGPVWDYSMIQTKDGHFDDYMSWLSTAWKAQEEALKKAGVILDYKVLLVASPRAGEPDIILAQEYKNMAVFDRTPAEEYALQAKISGGLPKANAEQAARGAIRTILGDMLVREAVLK
ncbi:hypothetical protein ACO2Q3_20650 [Caulobacter sp. KR2-114]|uniref:hypothetical protein n=1 Tax=Caulobacter sp. KR2-114 TaxID=3400912 RepID=UPI003C02934D